MRRPNLFATLGLLGIAAALPAVNAYAEDARVLPKGRSRFSVIYAQTAGISQQFDDQGVAESVTAPYNFDLSSEKLKQFSPDFQSLVNWLNQSGWHYNAATRDDGSHGLTRDATYPGLGDALSRGFLNVGAEAHREQYMFSYQYGVTDRLSVGLMLPYVKMQVNVDHSLTGINTANDAYYGFASSAPGVPQQLLDALNMVRSANDETFQNILVSKGYDRFGNWNGSGLGDAILGGRYNYWDGHHRSGDWLSSFQAGFTVPTGSTRPPSELTQVDLGNGCWSLGVANIVNYTPKPLPWLTLSNGLHYTYNFKDTRLMRVRKDPSDVIPDASDEESVSQHLGNKYSATLGAIANFTRAVNMTFDYEWWWKSSDTYQGSKTDRDYGYLADDTDSYTETIEIGATVSSIPAFMKYDFPIPGTLGVTLYIPTHGKNAIIAPYGTAELALYF